ncbi:MAG: sn-glycerol-3-phosphate ABC transporter ATP-binding protein UgpC [Ahrensia sp.]|nr:sn-glycerol-3-phosphate ABC transporter ATP-binding protein UgpC [Ahrensia sp.]
MAQVTIENVSKTYSGDMRAVNSVSIDIADGEFIVLVGPSGCGKSTLLRMVAGLETITEGSIRIGDRVVNDVEPAERDIAMVFQNYALYPHMSVRQNLAYGLKNRGTPKPEIEKRVADAAAILEIGSYLDRKPRQLSGGQRQRVAMGRAIVREPAAFLFDEPLSNLDAKLRVQMRGEIKQLQKRLGTTALYVTHDQLEAMTMADRIVVLNSGRIEQIGTPLEVYRRPESAFVASFIGSPAMNLIPAHGESGNLRVGDHVVAMTNGHAVPESQITFGVRAEDIRLRGEGEDADMELTIDYVEELGAGRLVHGRIGGAKLAVSLPSGEPLSDRLDLVLDRDRLHIFDHATGRRVRPETETAG